MKQLTILFSLLLALNYAYTQEEQIFSGLSGSMDLDHLADFAVEGPFGDKNYQLSMRGTLHGRFAGESYMLVPQLRDWLDRQIIFPYLDKLLYRPDASQHSLSIILEGFTPAFVSDETELLPFAVADGYSLSTDRPFSSFIGVKFSKVYIGNRIQAKSARRMDLKVNTSLSLGFAGTGIIDKIQRGIHGNESFGTSRPIPNLWERDSSKEIPTGEVLPSGFPLPMYSVHAQAVIFKPVSFLQVDAVGRVDLGYQTGMAMGVELGKAKKGARTLSTDRYSNAVSPIPFHRSKQYLAFNFTVGAQARAVLYNAHLNGLYSLLDRHFISFHDMRKFVFEGYASANVQLLRSVEVSLAFNARTAEIKNSRRNQFYWISLGSKILMPRFGF